VILALFLLRRDDAPPAASVTDAADRTPAAVTQRPDVEPRPTISRPATTPAPAPAGEETTGTPAAKLARAPARQRDIRSLEEEAAALPDTLTASPPAAPAAASPSPAVARPPASVPPSAVGSLPTATELYLKGELTGLPLHLDLHVYYPEAPRRVVFVNGRKYREGERLASGPMVREIVPEGVILTESGRNFLLQAE